MRLITPKADKAREAVIDWLDVRKQLERKVGFLEADKALKRLKHAITFARAASVKLRAESWRVLVWGMLATPGNVDVSLYDSTSPIGVWVLFPLERDLGEKDLIGAPYADGYYSPRLQAKKPGVGYGMVWRGY